jgi:hypothetical protein
MIITTRIFEKSVSGYPLQDESYAYFLAPNEANPNDSTNYWFVSPAALKKMLERSGWEIIKQEYFGYSGPDSSPVDPHKDKRIVALCRRLKGYENIKYGYILGK